MKRITLLILTIICTFGIFSAIAYAETARTQPIAEKTDNRLNTDGFTGLLDLVDVIIAQNPDYQSTIAHLQTMNTQEAATILDALAQKNAENPIIAAKMNSLLDSPAYKLYYAHFRNVTPDMHRKILCNLPYRGVDAPADIGSNLYQLIAHRDALRAWAKDILSKVDIQKSQSLALQWLPAGEYAIPTTYFIYDGNGDGFALNGEVGFDLYGALLSSRPEKSRYDNLSEISADFIQSTLAHEFFHVYAGGYLYPKGLKYANWQEQALDNLVRGFVNEGIAMQCNPPQGFKREVFTDSVTIKFWINQFNEVSEQLKAEGLTQPYFQQWREGTYQSTAYRLLENYLKRKYPEAEFTDMRNAHASDRPDLEHGLGWWMVYKITNDGKDKDKINALLADPRKIFTLYNESVRDMPSEFSVAGK